MASTVSTAAVSTTLGVAITAGWLPGKLHPTNNTAIPKIHAYLFKIFIFHLKTSLQVTYRRSVAPFGSQFLLIFRVISLIL
jgi:hypothetical protein